MEIIAHRGASYDAPENTLPAINLAWEQGADAVEVDVHLSRDGRLAVIHDANTRRPAGVNRRVSAQTWAELEKLEVGRWKGRQWVDVRIPSLEEVLRTVPKGRRLFVEVKCGPEFVAAAAPILQRGLGTEVVLIGFDLEAMKQAKAAFPQLEVCWIIQFKRNLRAARWTPIPKQVMEQARAAGLDGIDVGVRGPVTGGFVRLAHEAGLRVYIWTVDSVSVARRLIAAGVDGITTNRPGWLREKLESSGN